MTTSQEIAHVDMEHRSPHAVDGSGTSAAAGLRSGVVTSPEREFVTARLDDLRADLDAWLRIPSISADPAHASDVARSAQWLAEALRGIGFPTVEIWPTPGAPAVYAEWPSGDSEAPVALVYGHHDVQPVDPLELWVHPPFEPTVVEGPDGPELHARGAIDDKGNVAMHLLGMRAHLAATGRDTPAVTVKLLVEGEEESGSPHLAALLKERRARLDCDVVVVSDTGMAAPDLPGAVVSMRGLAGAEITLHGPGVDLHSGSFGGAVPNPLHAMASLLASLHDENGRVTLPGFYDKVRPLGDRERELMTRLPFDEQAWLAGPAAGSAAYGEAGFSTLERTGARPTAEVNGMWGGYQGPGHKTIIPAEAHAKISFRLVADQAPADIADQVRAWVDQRLPEGVTADVLVEKAGVAPCASDLDSPGHGRPAAGDRPGLGRRSRRGALPARGRQRTGGRPGRETRRSAAVPGCGAAHRPDPLAQRAGAAAHAAPRGRGGRAPLARTRRDPRPDIGSVRVRPGHGATREAPPPLEECRCPTTSHLIGPAPRDGGGLAHRLRGDDPQARPGGRRTGAGSTTTTSSGSPSSRSTCAPSPRYDLVIDRLAYWYYHPREWLKKVALMDDVYLLNSPFTFQSMEKHAAYCAMLRLGLHVPETVLVPYKNPPEHAKYAYTAEKYNQPFDLDAIAERIGYPLFMKPYDGGAWVGVSHDPQLRRTAPGLRRVRPAADAPAEGRLRATRSSRAACRSAPRRW